MKALSGKQPWWWWLFHGKGIENRRDESSAHKALARYREPFLLHASASVGTRAEFHLACMVICGIAPDADWTAFRLRYLYMGLQGGLPVLEPSKQKAESLPRGGIVGRACCVGLIRPDGRPFDKEAEQAIERLQPDLRWHMRGQWGHILDEVEPLPFVGCPGALGLWHVPDELLAQVTGAARG